MFFEFLSADTIPGGIPPGFNGNGQDFFYPLGSVAASSKEAVPWVSPTHLRRHWEPAGLLLLLLLLLLLSLSLLLLLLLLLLLIFEDRKVSIYLYQKYIGVIYLHT